MWIRIIHCGQSGVPRGTPPHPLLSLFSPLANQKAQLSLFPPTWITPDFSLSLPSYFVFFSLLPPLVEIPISIPPLLPCQSSTRASCLGRPATDKKHSEVSTNLDVRCSLCTVLKLTPPTTIFYQFWHHPATIFDETGVIRASIQRSSKPCPLIGWNATIEKWGHYFHYAFHGLFQLTRAVL